MLDRSPRLFCSLLLVLAAIAGLVDAAGFVLFDNVFVANMTGNSVMLGIAAVTGRTDTTVRAVLALLGFLAGAAAGTLLTDRARQSGAAETWPASVTAALVVEALLLIAAAAAWAADLLSYAALVFVLGAAMGVQSAAARKLAVPAVSTVVLTSTLTAFVARLIRHIRHLRTPERAVVEPHKGAAILFGVWIAYVIGAAAGAALAISAPAWVFAAPALMALGVVGAAALAARTGPLSL